MFSAPLDRAHVTKASRVMLPAYIALTGALGLVYLFDPLGNLSRAQPLAFPRAVMGGHMEPWGALFLALSIGLAASLCRGSALAVCLALCCSAVTFALWAVMYLATTLSDQAASVTASFWPAFVSTACVASLRSILAREV
jgi:hypothetical protein